ncbi:MAG: ABC transporter permease subunit [Rhodopirellula sp.]|nr:ABC transporter permease subunit [Rhodopirellula sp.]
MNTKVLSAVFKRNFVSYFASPTGYLFICMFVLLSAVAAFWPNEFFNTNLANLDQLNRWFPFIMLVFIPAITMSIWADERRQGTDELLLTIPASDFDIVLGKYLAAVAIYSVSLLFSLVCNYLVLQTLGDPDLGLFLGTYVGYWLVGLTMLSIGMVASFLTSNVTIGYILGATFNVPLVFAVAADTILGSEAARVVKQFSMSEQFADFSRGILSLSGLVYFGMIVVAMLYLSMILIGRRHWVRGRSSYVLGGHYLVRVLALIVVAVGANALFAQRDVRLDVTSEKLSSLSPYTKTLLKGLDYKRPVQIEAYISPDVPESYVQTKIDLLNMLRELQAWGGGKVHVRVNEADRYSEEAEQAEQRFGITPKRVISFERGTMSEDHIFMGAAFTSGLQKVILPFIDRGISVEYELVRSLATVTEQKRKRVGVVQTDAPLYGRFNMQTMSSSSNWPIIEELEKQYEVVQLDATNPITEKYDVLLAVQPSSMAPEQMDNFIAAIKSGQPTVIFEDPFPVFASSVPATTAPRQPPGGMNPMMMGGGQQPLPKGEIGKLWNLLGVDFSADQVVFQDYNPYPKLSHLPKEFVFVDEGSGAKEPFNEADEISSGLQHMLFPFPGSMAKLNTSGLDFTPLVRTGDKTGTVRFSDMVQMSPFGPMGGLNPNRRQYPQSVSYVLAAQIRGKVPADQLMADEKADAEPQAGEPAAKAEEKPPQASEVNVVVVADIDMLSEEFFRIREQGDIPEAGIRFDFDNVTFVLNTLDELAGDPRFIEIRKRRPKHRTLTQIEKRTEEARRENAATRDKLVKDYEKAEDEEQQNLKETIDKLEQRMKKENVNAQEVLIRVAMAQQDGQRRLDAKLEQLKQQRDREITGIETKLALEIRRVQDQYKLWAVLLPPIPPLLVAFGVFLTRRAREREGVSRSRLKS